ncbi:MULTISPECIES: dihydrolipoamide acetyltransferase family protein [Pseudomonas]|uniref:Dihydrolipoamide acetyltransferase component of pyruvate dehydrogenase complex n=1 Tax=Pseudomonas quercus TaxID=2722792 RepID=A0ABX0YF79_9PSED|nr:MULTISPECIES: dihydrolipoamide acetyltransferase family protein [Pseudomonas]MBF7143853.1 2-oxo acid dehydrogenase subunit E2 [Pseudomonas sp. LY10J]NJP02068.1 2-oxo acid dehydrogenase subunit E2 [Pseudomonas quercus]
MGQHVIKMPDIGEGIAQVELVEWFVNVGDTVTEDQVLADVMTDKATVEIPSPVSGRVLALGATPGQTMAVGSELIRLEVEGSGNVKETEHTEASQAPVTAPVAASVEKAVASAPEPVATLSPACESVERPLASPAVRKRAWDNGIDLSKVTGSGPAGRIVHADLDSLSQPVRPPASEEQVQRVPVIGLRRKIAERMQEATRRAAHFSYVEEIDVTALEQLRQQLNTRWGQARGRLTLLPLLVRALVVALRDFPQLNARYNDEQQVIERHSAVHVGIATQGEHGLLVPVLRSAHQRDLWGNAQEITRIAEAARHGKAERDLLSGSTITLTSLGALGGIVSTPVLNLPEVAIVGVNRMVERPVVVEGQVVVRKMMNLSSSFDHRVVDGMDAARFIQAVRHLLEQPATLFID